MSTEVYLLSLTFLFGTIVAIFAMKYFSAAFAARARIDGGTAYRTLAEKALAQQSQSEASLSAIKGELSKLAASIATVESILKQVG